MFSQHFVPEVWLGVGIFVLLAGLVYGAFGAGHLTRRERKRSDAAVVEMQREMGIRR